MLSKETLKYKVRDSARVYCRHCRKDRMHRCCLDPKLKKWIEICLICEMVDLADGENK